MASLEHLTKNPGLRYTVIAAAIMFSSGKTRAEIGEKLHRCPPDVTRLIQLAREAGYLSQAPTFLRHKVNEADFIEVQRRFFGEANFTPALKTLVPPGVHFEANVMRGSYSEFIHGAALHVCHLLKRAKRLGLMWGRTVHLLVENIKACGENLDRDALGNIECVPLCGDPIHLMNQRKLEYSASWLAVELERALRRPGAHREANPCLIGVPAYLSSAAREGARADGGGLVSHIQGIPGYEAIFGKKPGQRQRLADEVDTVIMGAGIIGPECELWSPARPDVPTTGDFIAERLVQEKETISKEALARLIYGDVGGVLLEQPDLRPADKAMVDRLNAGWTGMKEKDLWRIAQAAGKNGSGGLILVASSAPKADVLLAAISRGLVNQVVVDEPLMARLVDLAAATSARTRATSTRPKP
jgi:DNA-binding transcriptional regulator LsrR (DeoR family)